MEAIGICVDVLWIIRSPFKGAAAETSSLNLVLPNVFVDSVEVIF